MQATTEMNRMAKPKGRPKRSERRDRAAKIDSTILGWAEWIARAEGISVAELLSETLRAPLWRKFVAIMEESQGKGKP